MRKSPWRSAPGLVQPGLLLVHGLLQAVDGLQALLVGLRQFTDVGDEGIDDAEDALVLLGHRLGVDLRHARRIQVLAGLGEDRRQLSMRAVADSGASGSGANSRAIRP